MAEFSIMKEMGSEDIISNLYGCEIIEPRRFIQKWNDMIDTYGYIFLSDVKHELLELWAVRGFDDRGKFIDCRYGWDDYISIRCFKPIVYGTFVLWKIVKLPEIKLLENTHRETDIDFSCVANES